MRRVVSLAFLIATLFSYAVPSQATQEVAQKEWTVLVFLNGNNNLDSFGAVNINQMEKVGSTSDINLVVQWASYASDRTKRLLVQKGTDATAVTSPVVEDFPRVDMGDVKTLNDFIAWGIQKYPAKHYFIDVWDHGGGWHRRGQLRPYDISLDEFTGHLITTTQLGQAMATAAKLIGHKVDIYGSDACMMAMAEVSTELADSVQTIVGSEETEPGAGWPYDKFLQRWTARPTAGNNEIGRFLAEEYVKSFQASGTDVTFSVMDAGKLSALNSAVSDFAVRLHKLSTSDLRRFSDAAGQSVSFAYDDYSDFGDIIAHAEAAMPEMAPANASLKKALSDVVTANQVTSKYAKAQGLSIWFPKARYSYDQYSARYGELKFSKTGWGSVLDAITASAPTP